MKRQIVGPTNPEIPVEGPYWPIDAYHTIAFRRVETAHGPRVGASLVDDAAFGTGRTNADAASNLAANLRRVADLIDAYVKAHGDEERR